MFDDFDLYESCEEYYDDAEEFEREMNYEPVEEVEHAIEIYFTCVDEISKRTHTVCFKPDISNNLILEILEKEYGEIEIIGYEKV